MTSQETPGLRLWPLPALLLAASLGYAAAWRWRNDATIAVLAGITLLLLLGLLVWIWRFSRLRDRARWLGVLALGSLLAIGAAFVRIRGYTGATIPILSLRWLDAAAPELSPGVEGGPVQLTPGPFDSPEFLGPGRRPRFPAPELARDWQNNPPRELWRRPLGEGFSSFAVVGDVAFTQTQQGDLECVVCLDWRSGATRWLHADTVRFASSLGGNGPRATPTVSDGRVYALGATGRLHCLDASTGQRLWSQDLPAVLGAQAPDWGYSGSPLVVGERVIVSAGAPAGHSLVAFDRLTGAQVWGGGDDRAAYSSPMLARLAGEQVILIGTKQGLSAHDPDDGTLRWEIPRGRGENVSQPIVFDDDLVFHSKGYGGGSGLWRIMAETGQPRVEKVWSTRRLMKTKFHNPVLYEGHLFGLSDGTSLECIDPRTGTQTWRERGDLGHGQLIGTGSLLLILAEQGELVLVEANPERYVELARVPLFDARTWNPPVLIGRHLLARNDLEAVCLELPVQNP